jgi:hypothetical protein
MILLALLMALLIALLMALLMFWCQFLPLLKVMAHHQCLSQTHLLPSKENLV